MLGLGLGIGATTAISGEVSVDLPVNAAAAYPFVSGHGEAVDAGGDQFGVYARLTGADAMRLYADNGTKAVIVNTTVPMTWAEGDQLSLIGHYESAA